MIIKKLSDKTQVKVLGYPSNPRTLLDESKIEHKLKPFNLHESPDNNQIVELPIPDNFGTWQQETKEAVNNHARTTLTNLADAVNWELPEMPSNFQYVKGWQYWDAKADKWTAIAAPVNNKVFFLDIETVEVSEDIWWPTCAVAMSKIGWLLWVTDFDNMTSVIPYGLGNTMINYNTQYDRSYLSSEYQQADTGNRFFDLMSAWIVCRGLSNQQRPVYLAKEGSDWEPDWLDETATNSLSSVYEFLYGTPLDKGVRDLIVKGSSEQSAFDWVTTHMKDVIRYCCEDVQHTAEVHRKLYPQYLNHRPSEIAQSGSILLGSCWLPLDTERFPGYYDRAEELYQVIAKKTNFELMVAAQKFYDAAMTEYPYPEILFTKPVMLKISKKNPSHLEDQKANDATKKSHELLLLSEFQKWLDQLPEQWLALDWVPVRSGINKGTPGWFQKVQKDYKDNDLTLGKRFVPVILGLTWRGEDLLWSHEDATWYTKSYGWLPHPETRGKNVTSVFAKGFVASFDDGVLCTNREDSKELIAAKMSTVNWVSLRKRVASIHTESPEGFPVTLPQLLVNGTVTGRCADKIWQVASNPKKSRIGTELKSMVSPPKGWVFVGADVDSEESWLAGIMGDSVLGFNGSTPLGMINVVGQKGKTLEASTDIHSIMAKETGIDRDNTKNRVYGCIYGQGLTGDTNGLLKNMPSMTLDEAQANSKVFLSKFKGTVLYEASSHGTKTKRYTGGLASDSFNIMETIADSKLPRTPLLKNIMSKSLAGIKDFKPSRVNWTIQSSGVDFRDMLVLLVRHFFQKLNVDGKLILTIHDEIRTMVKDEQENVTNAILALQLAHLYTRAAFIDALSLDCIPAGVAWFSAVDVDHHCLRKDPEANQVTPSQPQGIPKGYTVSPKELLELLEPSKVLITA